MSVVSAGLLMCRFHNEALEFFLVHPGGPFYSKKDDGVWSIPKGIPDRDEDLLAAAQREFQEETGLAAHPPFISLGTARTKSGKTLHIWTFIGSWQEETGIRSNTFDLEWPPRSGRKIQVAEADRAAWMPPDVARKKINAQQAVFLQRAAAIFNRTIADNNGRKG